MFSGRATRPEYWWFALFVILTSAILAVVDNLLFGSNPETGEGPRVLSSLLQLAFVIPILAAGWRRLHHTGGPGWYLFLPMVLSNVTMVMLMTGVVAFSVLEQGVKDSEALRGPAALLGVTGILVVSILQLILPVLMIWWLTRPSESRTNEYGPPA